MIDVLNGMKLTGADLGREGYLTIREMSFQCVGYADDKTAPRIANWQQIYLLTTQRERSSLTKEQVNEAFECLITIYTTL